MAQILDKQGLQHYANKMCNADNRKVGAKSLPTVLNEIDTAIDGFKHAFEQEYGNPVDMEIANNQNIFSVGTGNNVDKKDDVENSFTDIQISGNTLINLMPTITGKSFRFKADANWTTSVYRTTVQCLKPNTTYTMILDIYTNNLSSTNNFHVNVEYNNLMAFTEKWVVNGIGRYIKAFTTKSNLTKDMMVPRTQIEKAEEGKYVDYSIVLLEGDWTNKCPPEYFEGLKSVGEKQDDNHKLNISSIGKNLCPYNNAEFQAISTTPWIDMLGKDGIYGGSNVSNTTKTWFYLSPAKYTVSFEKENCHMQIIDKNENIINFNKKFDGGYVCIRLKSTITSGKYCIKKLQIELSETQTSYEAYKIDTKEILLNEPLRGLPNGIKDTIEKINGEWKIIRRCGAIVLNGTENWTVRTECSNDKFTTFKINSYVYDQGNWILDGALLCDKMVKAAGYGDLGFKECIRAMNVGGHGFNISIGNNSLTSQREDSFKKWLSSNPLKVVYQLRNIIIEDIDPVTLQCWKNGTISIIDEVIPVETTHTVALNKSAQIQKNIEELTSLRNRVKILEEQYNKTALNQSYEVELLKLDMKLDDII